MSAHEANENSGAIDLGIAGIEAPSQVGAGASGVVYRARQTHLQRDVAIKVVTIAGVEPTEKDRFARECGILGGLSRHPNIVTVFDSGETTAGLPYLVMEYVVGGSLSGQVLTPDRLATVAVQLASALAEAHTTGVLHRDIKPANILSDEFGTPLLADFGLAVFANPDGYLATRGSIGTPAYMAPELFDADGKPTAATDVYAYGATLYALACGTAPYSAGAANALSIIQRALTEEPADLADFGVPDALAEIVHACLAKRAEDRLGSMLEAGRRFQAMQAAGGWAITPMMVGGEEPIPPHLLPSKSRDLNANRTVLGSAIGRRGIHPDEQPELRLGPAALGQPAEPVRTDTVAGPAIVRRPIHESDSRSFAETAVHAAVSGPQPVAVASTPSAQAPMTSQATTSGHAKSGTASGSQARTSVPMADDSKAPAGSLLAVVIVFVVTLVGVAALGGVALAGGFSGVGSGEPPVVVPADEDQPNGADVAPADVSSTTSPTIVTTSTTDSRSGPTLPAPSTSTTVVPATGAPTTTPPTTTPPTTTPPTTTPPTTTPPTTTPPTTRPTTTRPITTTTQHPTTTTAPTTTTPSTTTTIDTTTTTTEAPEPTTTTTTEAIEPPTTTIELSPELPPNRGEDPEDR